MVRRWVAAAFLATEKNFRRILGYRDLWMLKAKLKNEVPLTYAKPQPNLYQPLTATNFQLNLGQALVETLSCHYHGAGVQPL